MKFHFDRKWLERRIVSEENMEVEAGGMIEDVEASAEDRVASREDEFVEGYAFGKLVRLLRRQRKLSIEQLALNSHVTSAEVLAIEQSATYVPKPRTVHQLAKYFKLPERSLLQLANVTAPPTGSFRDAAVRFAANSSKIMELSSEEQDALSQFVRFLADQDTD